MKWGDGGAKTHQIRGCDPVAGGAAAPQPLPAIAAPKRPAAVAWRTREGCHAEAALAVDQMRGIWSRRMGTRTLLMMWAYPAPQRMLGRMM